MTAVSEAGCDSPLDFAASSAPPSAQKGEWPLRSASSALALAAAAAISACQHHEEAAGPDGLPYACADGRIVRIVFDGGDPNRAAARLRFEGRDFSLAPAPAMNGLRYVGGEGPTPGHALVWWSQGDEAVLSEAPADAPGEEREIVRCSRVRDGAPEEPAGGHGEDH